MKKKLIAILMALASVGVAKANLLYWQLTTPADVYDNHWDTTATQREFAYVEIVDSSGTAYTLIADNSSAGATKVKISDGSTSTGLYAANIGDVSASTSGSFYVVLYDSSKQKVAWSEEVSYSSVSSSISTAAFNSNWASMQTLTNASFKFVPEPTSGLLMLLGAALLGLRRKRIA